MTKHSKKIRILVADDHELVRQGIRGLLQSEPALRVVGESADGRETITKARKLKPDIAILDIGMPVQDGLEATRQMREAAPETKILILTMHDSDQMVRRVLEAGALGYVLKSDLAKHLIRAVKSVSKGKVYLTPKVSEIVLDGFIKSANKSQELGSPQNHLTEREISVVRLLTEGKANKEIAAALQISVRTVETHRARILRKLGLHSLSELLNYAFRNQIASTPVAHEEWGSIKQT